MDCGEQWPSVPWCGAVRIGRKRGRASSVKGREKLPLGLCSDGSDLGLD
jgi:hypothetical protein